VEYLLPMRFKHMLDFGLLKIDDDPWSCGKGKQYRHTRTRTVELLVPYFPSPAARPLAGKLLVAHTHIQLVARMNGTPAGHARTEGTLCPCNSKAACTRVT